MKKGDIFINDYISNDGSYQMEVLMYLATLSLNETRCMVLHSSRQSMRLGEATNYMFDNLDERLIIGTSSEDASLVEIRETYPEWFV